MEEQRNTLKNCLFFLKKTCAVPAIIAVLFALNGCGNNKTPSGVLPPEKMQDVLWDLIRVDELAMEKRAADSAFVLEKESEKMYQQVFAMHGTDKQTFEKSFSFYKGRPDLSKTIFDSLINEGNREKELLRKADSVKAAKEMQALAKADSIKRRADSIKIQKDSAVLKKLRDSLLLKRKLPFKAAPK